ncbi:hypothetical protein ACIBBD_12750 [Streptomyces sp. NPDC051315]|uniref:hypothetical protein n=1 Tax=Streptomyces sp. NPDC051315 TaxID=3365650 RepID=UPI00379B9834
MAGACSGCPSERRPLLGPCRWGEPDLLLPDLVAAGVLAPDGQTCLPPEDEDHRTGHRRSPGVVERRFGLSPSPAFLRDARLPAYAVRATPRMTFEV